MRDTGSTHITQYTKRRRAVVPADQISDASDTDQPEMLLGRYRVLARCGHGGFGTVCTCWDTRLQRRVAIKRMPLTDIDAHQGILTSTVDEALAEARTACLLAHPNIVSVHDFESDEAYAYLVMEFVDGLNLSELLARVEGGTLTHDELAHVVTSLGHALAYAHENGVLHLDIKPTNVMIDRQGTVKLADFGMATLASATGYGDARGGTVGYMPPEQIEGFLVDERADVFSLAAVVRQALTGHNIYAGKSAKESLTKMLKQPHTLEAEAPTLSRAAIDELNQALSSDSARRPANVAEFSDSLSYELGDKAAGEKSLRELIGQTREEEDGPLDDGRLPLDVRYPWLFSALSRITSAATTALLVFPLLKALVPESMSFQLTGIVLSAAAAALWTPLGSALVLSAFIYALASISPTSTSFPLAAISTLLAGTWWVLAGRTNRFATSAGLFPALFPPCVAAPELAGATLKPLPACLTGAFGYLFGIAFSKAMPLQFAATPLSFDLLSTMSQPSFWIMCLGCALSSYATALVSKKRSRARMIFGQIVGLVLFVGTIFLASYVENKSFLPSVNWVPIIFAVTLCVLVCIVIVLTGPHSYGREGEDMNELY